MAILLVLIFHFTMGMSGRSLPARLLLRATSVGWCGVDLFFVLSGFLITGILYDTRLTAHRFRNFYMRRALRIFPLYYASLIVTFVALRWVPGWMGAFKGVEEAWPWLWTYRTNHFAAVRGMWFPLSHYWSLAVEEHFYLVWPLIIFGFSRKVSLRVCGMVVLLALVIRCWLVSQGAVLAAYCLTLCRMDALAIGALVALAARGEGGVEALVPYAKRGVQFGVVALLALVCWRRGLFFVDAFVQVAGYLTLDLCFASLLVLVVAAPCDAFLTRFFQSGTLRFLGKYSYGLYVYNSIFILLADGGMLMPWLSVRLNSALVLYFAYVMIAVAVTFSMTLLSWHLIEKPVLKLKHLFGYENASGRVDVPGAARVAVGAFRHQ